MVGDEIMNHPDTKIKIFPTLPPGRPSGLTRREFEELEEHA